MNHVINVCFHGIGTPGPTIGPDEARYWITRETFLRLLDEVATWSTVALSFDDGNASDVDVALPALLDRGLDAQFFVLAGRLDTPGSLGRADVRSLVGAGMGVGSHGMDHVSFRGLDAATARRELVEARASLAELAGPVHEVALPRGQYDRTVLSRLRRLGYSHVHTSDRRPAQPDAWLQPRYSVTHDTTALTLRAATALPRPLPERLERAAKSLVKRLR